MNQALSVLLILSTLFTTAWADGNEPAAPGKKPGKANSRQGENTYETTATPTITTLSPTRNQLNVAANASVAINFSEAMLASTASNAAIRVFGSRTGKRSGTFSGAGTSTATFQASQVFRPGELVSVITTTAAKNAGGTPLDKPLVYQFTAAAGVGPANFIANPTLSTGGTPHGIYPADFDGDGDMDVAVANAGSSYLTLRLNNGDGTFAASNNVALPAGGSAEAVFAADLDGDEDMDLATANTGLGSISVRMNNGAGVFSGGADYPASATVGSKPSDITGADFDGDGDIDLVTTLKAQNTVAVFINDGTGTFTRNIYVGGSSPHGVCTADFDGDGDMDIAMTNTTSFQVTIKMNDGTGVFSGGSTVSTASNSQSIQAVDLNGDGKVDLAAANISTNNVSVRFNDGTGTFSGSTEVAVGNRPFGVFAADLDGDGDMDLMTANQTSNDISIRMNNGSGVFSGTTDLAAGGNQTWALQAADFDGDNDLDIAVVNGASNRYTILLNKLPAGSNTLPTISSVASQTLCANTSSSAIAFTVGDGETPVASLTVAGTSSNTTLIPNTGIVVGGTGDNRTVTLTPSANQTGTATITLTVTDGEPSSTSVTFTLTVNAAPTVVAGTNQTICANAAAFALTGFSPAGGVWSGNGVNATGTFTPSASLVGTQTLTYTVTQSGCTASATKTITVNALPTVNAGANQSVCADAAAFTLTGFSPAGGTWSGNGVNASGTFTPSAALVGTQTLTYTVTQNGCTNSATKTLTVTTAPTVVAGSNETVCASAAAFTLTGFSPAGGAWSGNGVNATGTFTPSASLVGTQTLTYTVTQSGCTASATKTVTVNAAPTVVAGTDQSVCSNAATFTLTGFSPAGGTWSGNGVNATGTFTPSGSLVGVQTLTYSVTQSGCTSTATKKVTVNALPTVNAGTNQSICADAAPFALTGFSPAGGTWSGNGVNASGTFTPSASLVGTQTLTYSVTQNGCTASATKTVTVNAAPTVVAGSNQAVCSDAAPFALAGFSPAGGTWSGNGVSASGTFTPSASLVGTQTLTYTVTQSGCTSSATKTITVNALPTVNAGGNQSVCADAAPFALTGLSPAGGTWSGNGVNSSGTFTPSASLVGTQTLTYIVTQNGCTNSATKTVTVTTAPTVVAGSNEAVCASAAAFTLTGFSPAGGTWSGNGVSASGTFTPSASLVGTQTLSYTVTQSGCTASATKTVTVNAAPTVVAGTDQGVCADAAAFALTGFSPAGGTWSGNGVDAAGTFTPSASLVGTQTLTYTVTQSGCTASATKTVTVNAIPVVSAGSNQTVCASAAPFALSGFSPAGGTWSGSGVSADGTFTPAASLIGNQTLTYTVTQNGCTASATKTVTVSPEITLSETKINNTDCGNPNGSIHLTVTGGNAPYTVIWSNGATGTHLSALSAGTYSVSVSDAAGCTASQSYTISDPNAPAAFAITGGGSYCEGGTGVSVGLSGSENGVTYQLLKDNVAEGSPINGTGSALDFGLKTAAGTYTVRAQNTGACSAQMTGSVSVTVDQKPALNITQPAARCAPATVDLTALSITDTHNTTGTLSYWTDATATTVLPDPASVSVSGTYYIKKTTTAGCSDIQSVVVNIQTSLTADAGTDQNVCADAAPFTLTGFSPAGGTWSGNGVSADGTFTPSASLVGTHTLTYTIAQGNCTATATKTVTVSATPSAPVAAANNPTAGENLLLTASPVSGATYQWTGPLNFSSTEQNPVINNATVAHSGTYTVTVNVNGCTSTAASVQAMVNPPVVPASVTLALDSVAGNNGTSVVVRLRVKDFRNILSAQGSIQWNPAVATYAGVESFGLPGMNQANFGTTQTGNGSLAFSWSDASLTPRTLTDDAALFAIRFNLTGANGTATAVNLTNSPAVMEVIGAGNQPVPTNLKAGNVQVVAMTTLAGVVKSPAGSTIRGVGFNVTGSNSPQSFTTSADGLFNLQILGGNFTLTPFKNNDVVSANGVTTLDLVLIQRHILGLTPLGSPYKIIAADVNQSGSVTTLDIVLMRSLILQNTTSFPGNQLWTFVRSDYTFTDPTQPFPYDHSRTYQASGAFSGQNFIGVKLGDVNDTWDAGIARIETEGEVGFVMENQRAMPGDEITVPVKARDFHNVSGYQFTLNWNPKVLELAELQHQALIANYGSTAIKEGKLSTSWQDNGGNSRTLPDDSTLFNLRFKVIGGLGTESYLRINSSMTASEAYNDHLGYLSVVSPERRIQVGEPVAPAYGYELHTGQPNPFNESTLIRFSLPKEEMVTLAIYNSLGQLVKTLTGQYPAGAHQVSWNGTAEAGQRLGAGTYLVQMRAGQFVKSRKLIKVE